MKARSVKLAGTGIVTSILFHATNGDTLSSLISHKLNEPGEMYTDPSTVYHTENSLSFQLSYRF
jgi:hypothetical protein